ncbi:putative phosphoenolpyruvate synthase [Uloborus diversus]|uniref:putative phosphoenolpyruvate synthase n=1 Tax=Uloborus diversus TaxID=327109 RepID=UPI00240A5F0E|nr:putative phosphoenolpyruvate synthase [Uloborus diversus]
MVPCELNRYQEITTTVSRLRTGHMEGMKILPDDPRTYTERRHFSGTEQDPSNPFNCIYVASTPFRIEATAEGFSHLCKWTITYLRIRATDFLSRKRFDYFDFYARNEPEKSGFLSPEVEFELESPCTEPILFEVEDNILCYGVNSKSETLIVSLTRLCDEKAEACVFLKLANGKTYQLKETSDYQQPNADPRVFSCGGLQMHYECPIRRWRIFYNGFLSETSCENPELEQMVYVKFAFLWRASSNVFDFTTDIHPNLLADGLSKAAWKQPIPPVSQLTYLHSIGYKRLQLLGRGFNPVQLLVVPFSDVTCQDPDLTGGKGSSLGKLTSLSKELRNFVVPNGVVVTTAAYEKFITKNIAIAIKQVCDKIIQEKLPETLKDAIRKSLNKSFPKNMRSLKFAVRSSATGEDTEQMSAAGQMDTFLGVSGTEEIFQAVKKCWASQFGHIAVEYKRRYGQVLNSPMAVVIQEMVPCDVAGVMFTCDPLTGNPTLMSITANYGLGESVVSGSEEPDAIVLSRDYYDDMIIRNKTIGAKSRKIIVKDGEGATLEEVPEDERNDCCLTDEMALRLGKVGVQIEKHYRSRRDIEFGFWNNNLYIFQSRPVTCGTQETDFEIEHEFDAPLRVENDSFSIANAAEVLSGSLSPLGYDIFFRMFNPVWQRGKMSEWQGDVPVKYFPICWVAFNLHVMFNIPDLFRGMEKNRKEDLGASAVMVAFMGRLLDDPEMAQVSKDRFAFSTTKEWPWMKPKRRIEAMFFAGKHLDVAKKIISDYRIQLGKCRTSQEVFDVVTRHSADLAENVMAHLFCSQGSSMWNLMILTTLAQAKGEFDESVYKDFSTLVTTSSDVESADVPAAIQSLAYHVSQAIKPEDFKKMDTEKALQWLKVSTSSAGEKFRDFLTKHGHRCVKEFDVHSITWGSDPKPLVKLLQDLAGHVTADASQKEATNFDVLVSKLSAQLGYLTKLKMRFLLKMAQRGVQQREMSKSLWIKGIDIWRQSYRHLARVMVAEGRIPDEDIMFFMTLEDVRELLKTRSPRILAKARHRRRLHPKMDRYIFPEISRGLPRPINSDEDLVTSTEDGFTMKGIPVSQGVAKGYVRVAFTLEDASKIKPGEILLAYSTDIGWTPYFPMLAGCVTELGGLISHGAVVSREYGLPCVAGLHGATRRFQTGDYVLLDGNKGELRKIASPLSVS